MPRRGNVPKREVLPDPVYQSPLVTRFINCLMYDGKKSTAESIFYGAMQLVQERAKDDARAQLPESERATAKFEYLNQVDVPLYLHNSCRSNPRIFAPITAAVADALARERSA